MNKRKLTKGKISELDGQMRQHNKRARQAGRHRDQMTFDQYVDYVFGRKGKREFVTLSAARLPSVPTNRDPKQYAHGDVHAGSPVLSKGKIPAYTGDLIKGIGVMHKSNLIPVTSSEQAKDLTKMRRN